MYAKNSMLYHHESCLIFTIITYTGNNWWDVRFKNVRLITNLTGKVSVTQSNGQQGEPVYVRSKYCLLACAVSIHTISLFLCCIYVHLFSFHLSIPIVLTWPLWMVLWQKWQVSDSEAVICKTTVFANSNVACRMLKPKYAILRLPYEWRNKQKDRRRTKWFPYTPLCLASEIEMHSLQFYKEREMSPFKYFWKLNYYSFLNLV